MPPRGPALTFDARYVLAAIDAWRARDLAPITPLDLERETVHLLHERFTAWTIMGMREQPVSPSAVTKAVGVLTALKLAKKSTKGKGEARVIILTTTTEGSNLLADEPIGGALYPRFAACLSSANPDLANLLQLLAVHGPLSQPVLHPTATAPRRGPDYQAAITEGLREYRRTTPAITTPPIAFEPANAKPTPPQRLKAAQTWANQVHPAGAVKQLDKVVAIGLAFGLLWVDVTQVNEVIGAKSIGLAATLMANGYRPNYLSWPGDSGAFLLALIKAVTARDNGSGFATIQEVRGTIGRQLQLSPIAVDVLLREARDAGDRHEIPIELHFEPDEDQLYAVQRDPLIWRNAAFEFVAVLQASRT